jgi:[ribosomal protein S18]-alanine N-acetyltransferase
MGHADISQVVDVDRESYPMPWPAGAYRRELNNEHARYFVLREQQVEEPFPPPEAEEPRRSWRSILAWPRSGGQNDGRKRGRIIGYAGMWTVADEAHVTTIAVRTANRGSGFGELLLASLIGQARVLGIRWVTLEVRITNEVAQSLYEKYGFRKAGMRRRYYSDNNEDALIMTTDDITLNAYQAQFDELLTVLKRHLNSPLVETAAPVLARA